MEKNLWLANRQRKSKPRFRVFAFHHAGGSASLYANWENFFPNDVEFCPVTLPGHWERPQEALISDLGSLLVKLDQGLANELDRPFAVIGFSLGALISFEWIRQIRQHGKRLPTHFVTISKSNPQRPHQSPAIHQIADDQTFYLEIEKRYGAMPATLRQDPEMFRFFVRVLRADMQILENYQYQKAEPLPVPITALGGTLDQSVSQSSLNEWKFETSSDFVAQQFLGDHFVLKPSGNQIGNFVVQRLDLKQGS